MTQAELNLVELTLTEVTTTELTTTELIPTEMILTELILHIKTNSVWIKLVVINSDGGNSVMVN